MKSSVSGDNYEIASYITICITTTATRFQPSNHAWRWPAPNLNSRGRKQDKLLPQPCTNDVRIWI